jgi:long-chain acyl-CoA synthetase
MTAFPRRIHDLVTPHVQARPDAVAVIDHDGQPVTWRDYEAAITGAARHLVAAGVRPGDRVLIVNENSLALAALIMACSRLDAWAVPVNARLSGHEIGRIRTHCAPRAMVFTVLASRDAARYAAELGAFVQDDNPAMAILGQLPGNPEPVFDRGADQVAVMLYTSGTTGEPKGVMLSHENLLFVAIVPASIRGARADDRVYAVLPLSHIYGLASIFLGVMRTGSTIQFVPRFDPAHLAQALRDGITVFPGVPPMYAKLLEYLDERGQPLVAPVLRTMTSGGAPLDPDWKRRIEKRFNIPLHNGYGLTESAATVSVTPIGEPRGDDSVGPALPGIELRFIDQEGRDVPEDAVGELWLRGPSVMKGYYRNPEATAQAITPDGWLMTGDLARRSPDGHLYIVGRVKELIIRSGFNVYPPEVETAINACPGVVQCSVVGRPVSGNEEVVAFVETVPGSGLTTMAIQQFIAGRLAPYKRPQHMVILDRMPASATGKIQKKALARMAQELAP